LDQNRLWFAGSEGIYGHTNNAGKSWQIDSIKTDTIVPHFRSIAVTSQAIHLLSIGSPALLYRSTDQGQSWSIVYQEDHPNAFYDAMVFWDDQYGIAMGDPTDGCLSVIRTEDGGWNWEKVNCDQLPVAAEGEAAFAASNSNLSSQEEGKVWMVSGGKRARVYASDDYGKSWQVYDTPIAEGGQMTGIYTVDFQDAQNGVIFGGDWNDMKQNTKNKAATKDGGRSWQLLSDGNEPGFQSCVKYIPNTAGQGLLTCGIPGINYTLDQGKEWMQLSNQPYYTLSFGSDEVVWLAGRKKIGRLVLAKD
jgi:photosystem II stability/assembly factor-like uncharacterized protein